ncbi:hypothetical protein K488DRAFT_74860 [Vararia minispora EC-137]|uniref:Uncharacterized protein n=1 Tax=Vararia minispora EC-137 TaxID=1314806 RepID=A0ACB8Q5S1_9AGAM|nr:hypothetical protein K488DRAFT_74860 [Vararia minispora EC-137]
MDARSLWAPALQELDALFEYAGMGLRRCWNLENAHTGPSRPRPSPIVHQPQAHQVGAEDVRTIDLNHASYVHYAWEERASEICEDKKEAVINPHAWIHCVCLTPHGHRAISMDYPETIGHAPLVARLRLLTINMIKQGGK